MSDNNYPPGNFCDQDGLMIDGLVLSPPDQGAGFDDIFKLSRVTGSKFYNVTAQAGKQRENALDMNRNSCGNYFSKLKLDAGQECALLCKGGSNGNTWQDVEITRAGGHSDLYFYDYSDQSKKWGSGNAVYNVRRTDGQPVRVRWAWGWKPIVQGPSVKFQYCLSFVSFLYVLVKTILHPKSLP